MQRQVTRVPGGRWSYVANVFRVGPDALVWVGEHASPFGGAKLRGKVRASAPILNRQRRFFYNPLPWTLSKSCLN